MEQPITYSVHEKTDGQFVLRLCLDDREEDGTGKESIIEVGVFKTREAAATVESSFNVPEFRAILIALHKHDLMDQIQILFRKPKRRWFNLMQMSGFMSMGAVMSALYVLVAEEAITKTTAYAILAGIFVLSVATLVILKRK